MLNKENGEVIEEYKTFCNELLLPLKTRKGDGEWTGPWDVNKQMK